MSKKRALVIGHRGCGENMISNHQYCENTLESFIKAHESGVDAIEFDVHITRDGVLVVFHNFCIVTTETNTFIHELSFEEFLEAGKEYVRKERPLIDKNNSTNIPGKLEDIFKQINENLLLNLEIKYPKDEECTKFSSPNLIGREEFVTKLFNVIDKYSNRKIFISSFDIEILIILRKKCPKISLFFLKNFSCNGRLNDFVPLFSSELKTCIFHEIKGVVFNYDTLNYDTDLLFQIIKSFGLEILLYGRKLNEIENIKKKLDDMEIVDGFIVDDVIKVTNHLRKNDD